MDGKITRQQVDEWLRTASPDDVTAFTRQSLTRVASLDERYREQFTREIGADARIAKLMKHPAENV